MSLVIPAKAGIQILRHYGFRIKYGMTNHLRIFVSLRKAGLPSSLVLPWLSGYRADETH
jgi:hypothetical protein